MSHWWSKAPLRLILILSFVTQISLVVGLTGWLSIRNGQRAVDWVADELWDEITARTVQHLRDYTQAPKEVIADTVASQELDLVDLENQATLARYLWHQVRTHEGLFITAVGYETGKVLGVGIESDGQMVIRATDAGQTQLHTYAVSGQGNRGELIKADDFNVTSRPWYREAVAAGALTWTEIYPNYAQPFNIISAVSPIYDTESDRLIGVTNATLSLWQISQFLEALEVSPAGEIFIIERSGDLVASSTGEVLSQLQKSGDEEIRQRLNVLDSESAIVRGAAQHLIQQFSDLNQIQQVEHTEFRIDGKRQIVQVTPFSDELGLDWLIAVVIPESDFMEQIYANTRTTVVLCMGALVLAIVSSMVTARWITQPILKLKDAAREIASGQLQQSYLQHDTVTARTHEVGELAKSFNQMTQRLQSSFSQLQDVSDRLGLAVQSADIGIWDWDIVNDRLFWDDRMYELYGIRPNEFSGAYEAWEAMIHPDDVPAARSFSQQTLAGERDYQTEFRVVWPDGSIHYLEAYALVQRDSEGKPMRMIGINLEVTERKQAEENRVKAENLKQELNLLENILDSVLAGYWDWDIFNHTEYMSPGLKRMFGYEDHELPNLPETRQHLMFQEDWPSVLKRLDRHIQSRGEVPYYHEVRYRHKDGSTIWVISAGQVIDWDDSGQPLRMIGCHVDITRLKQAELRLRRSDTHLKLAQRIGRLGSWEFDLQTSEITWSDEVFRIFGRDPASGAPRFEELQQILHPDDRELHQQTVERAIATVQSYDIECRLYRHNEDLVYIQAKGEPIVDDSGQITQLVGTILDISDRKQAEASLRQSEATNRALISAIPDLLIWIDQDGTYLDVLGSSRSLQLCKSLSEQVGANIYEVLPYPQAQERMHYVQRAIQTRTLQVYEYQLEVNGEMRDEEARLLVCGDHQVLCMVRDITKRKQAETQLLQTTAQLEASNRELEAFAYSVSHDLRAPLRAIDGFSKALVEDYADQFDEDGKDFFKRIRHNAQRMGMLIDDLLKLSRISRSEMRYGQVDLSAMVQEHIQELQTAEPKRQVETLIASGVKVMADPTLMRVVISNLVENAWKFTSHHATARIEFGIIEQDERIIYFIRDDGAGFDMAYSSMLFGVFQRLHNTTEFPGTGVGLATVRRAIYRHGGEVWAEAAVEHGATIYFTLFNSSTGARTSS